MPRKKGGRGKCVECKMAFGKHTATCSRNTIVSSNVSSSSSVVVDNASKRRRLDGPAARDAGGPSCGNLPSTCSPVGPVVILDSTDTNRESQREPVGSMQVQEQMDADLNVIEQIDEEISNVNDNIIDPVDRNERIQPLVDDGIFHPVDNGQVVDPIPGEGSEAVEHLDEEFHNIVMDNINDVMHDEENDVINPAEGNAAVEPMNEEIYPAERNAAVEPMDENIYFVEGGLQAEPAEELPDPDFVPPVGVERCQFCHRTGCASLPLVLSPLQEGYKRRRKIGDIRNVELGSSVCTQCRSYLNGSDLWSCCWPAFTYTVLTSINHRNSAVALALFPLNILSMWRGIDNVRVQCLEYLDRIEEKVGDITIRRTEFLNEIRSGRGGSLVVAHERENFPNIICPMGCNLFIDDEIRLVGIHHFIQFMNPSFKMFGANLNEVVGKRPDWPAETSWAGIAQRGGAIVDFKCGLSIVTCKAHCKLSNEIIHVPKSPVLNHFGLWDGRRNDLLAPVVASVNLTKLGKAGRKKNTHYSAVKLRSDKAGISSFSLARTAKVMFPLSDVDNYKEHITAVCRPAVKKNADHCGSDYFGHMENTFEDITPSEADFEEIYKASGSFVPVMDAVNLAVTYNDSSHKKSVLDSMLTLPLNSKYGRHPFLSVNNTLRLGGPKNIAVSSMVISVISNCRALHFLIVSVLRQGRLPEEYSIVLNLLMKYLSIHKIKNPKVDPNFRAMSERLVDFVVENGPDLVPESSVEILAAHFIKLIIGEVKIFEWTEGTDPAIPFFDAEENIILVLAEEGVDIPITDETQNYHLMLKASSPMVEGNKYNECLSFRWARELQWINVSMNGQSFVDEPQEYMPFNIFVSDRYLSGSIRGQRISLEGVQHNMLCAEHRSNFLMREKLDTDLRCPHCRRKIAWRCSYGFGELHQCSVGVCNTHAKDHLNQLEEQVYLERNGEALPDADDAEVEDEDLVPPVIHEAEVIEHGDEPIPLFTNTERPQYAVNDDPRHWSPSHYLLNEDIRGRARMKNSSRAPICHQQTLHQIFARAENKSIPLSFPDSTLHPGIFPFLKSGAHIGGLPSLLYTRYGNESHRELLGSFHDHAQIRLRDLSIPTSRDLPYLCHLFDSTLNRLCDNNSIKMTMRKGLEVVNRCYMDASNTKNPTIGISLGGHRPAERLAKSMKDNGHWHYFLTLTCNENKTPGIAALRQAVIDIYGDESLEFTLVMHNIMPIICRSWERYVRNFFNYLLITNEPMFGGRVKNFWYRFEYQSSGGLGNLPHVHGGIVLEENLSKEERLQYSSCRTMDMFGMTVDVDTTEETLISEGYVKDSDEYCSLYQFHEETYQHDCRNARGRCMKRKVNGEFVCRVPWYPPSFTGEFEEYFNVFTEEAMNILIEVDVANEFGDLPPALIPCKFTYANNASHRGSTTNGKLFSMFKSNTNVQVTDQRFQQSYVVKYASGSEERRDVHMRGKEDEEVEIVEMDLYNAKISGAGIAEQKMRRNRNIPEPLAKEVCIVEMAWFTLGLPYVVDTFDYVECSYCPLDKRGRVLKLRQNVYRSLINDDEILTVTNRQDLPNWRRFSIHQENHVKEILESQYMPDETTRFNIRCPELMAVTSIESYLRWFTRHAAIPNYALSENLQERPLQDGLGKVIKVRFRYLVDVCTYYRDLAADENGRPDGCVEMRDLFALLYLEINADEPSEFFLRFVDVECKKDVTVQYYQVPPANPSDFLFYFILRFGKITCEREIFAANSLGLAFQAAGIVRDYQAVTLEEYRAVMKMYIEEELSFLSIRVRQFESYLKAARDILHSFLIERRIQVIGIPLITDQAIQDSSQERLDELESNRLGKIFDHLDSLRLGGFPTREEVDRGDGRNWVPELNVHGEQTQQSIREQRRALSVMIDSLNMLQDPEVAFVKSIVLVGPPGSGKSHILFNSIAYCVSQQIKCAMMSYTADRSRATGGNHFHLLFCVQVYAGRQPPIQQIVDDCIAKLMAKPIQYAFLKRLRVLFVDEIGLLSAEQLTIMDLILRHVKSDDRTFGSVLLIGVGDHRQLTPISGTPVWMSSMFLTSIRIIALEHLVRSSGDDDLQRLITLMRQPSVSNVENQEVCNILRARCRNHAVESWNDVPESHLRIVSTKAAMNECEGQYIEERKAQAGAVFIVSRAVDEVAQRNTRDWVQASDEATKQLDYKCAEKSTLCLFLNSVMEMTFNNNRATASMPIFSQGQRCVVVSIPPLPDLESDHPDNRVSLRLMPPDAVYRGPDDIQENWPRATLRRRRTPEVSYGTRHGSVARREQWPLRYHICVTIHRVIGNTCSGIATRISGDRMYSLWEREMLLVLVSRVRNLDQLIFVGGFRTALNAISKLLKKTDTLVVHMDQRMNSLNSLDHARQPVMRPGQHRFSSLSAEIPEGNGGFAYLLVSLPDPTNFMIREGVDIKQDLQYYNGSTGLPTTLAHRPWLLAGYCCNFPNDTPLANANARRIFQQTWLNNLRARNIEENRTLTWNEVVEEGVRTANEANDHLDIEKFVFNVCLRERPVRN